MKTMLILLIDRLLHLTEGDLKRPCMSLRLISFLILLGAMPTMTMAEPNRHRDGGCGHENYSDNYYVLSWDNGSGSFGSEGSENLFDSKSNTKWCANYPLSDNAETYVIFHFGGNVRLVSYTLTTANDTQEYPGRNWTAWTIYGGDSPDGEWTQVDKKVGQTLPSANYTVSEPFEVDGTNTTAYQYYKIVIDAIGDGNVQQMADINFNVACSGGHEHGTDANPHVDKNNDEYCDLCGIFIISPAPQVDGVYQISNAGNLYWFAEYVNAGNTSANAKLINDIVVNKNVLVNGALNTDATTVSKFLSWTPIGYHNSEEDNCPYSGTFDGDNHTISGLYYNNGGTDNVGLFGYLAYGSVKNVGVIDSYFNAQDNVGAIVGCIDHDDHNIEGTISNCYNTGICQGNQYVGGIVGFVEGLRGAKITNCYNTGTIKGTFSGGVVGMLANAEIANCYNTGSVSGTDPGGIVSYTFNITISKCCYLKEQGGINSGVYGIGDTEPDDESKTAPKITEQFVSGEVAYLLQGSQETQVWGQNIDNGQERQNYPVLSDARVYEIVVNEETSYSNFMGGSVVWLYEDGILTIHGSGSMIDFGAEETKPWEQYLSDINTVIVKEGITRIGNYAFNDVNDDAKIFFYRTTAPESLGTNCFKENASVYIPAFGWDITGWSLAPTVMPTYKQTTVNGQQTTAWAGLTGNATEPSPTDNVAINADMTIADGKSLSVKSFGYCSDDVRITIEDGGQLTCQQAHGEVTVKRAIEGYNPEPRAKSQEPRAKSQSSTQWYTISSPLKDEINLSSDVSNITNITSGTYDLYRYDEPSYTWENYKNSSSNNFTSLEPGRGYLYANAANTTLLFKGKINTESVTYNLTIGGAQLTGFHLVGNPFTHNITAANFTLENATLAAGYYVLSNQGAWETYLENTGEIKPGQGALIKTTAAGNLTINNIVSSKGQQPGAKSQEPMLSLNVTNGNYSDRAFVIFSEGEGLDKINHENKDIPMLYIPMSDADYAIAMMDESVSEIPVGFETNKMGEFTISLRQENCEFEELYLLDKETGAKIDILEQDYTFMATSGDNPDRFILFKSQGSQPEAQSNFAYISNGDVVIYNVEGNAHIDIYDVLGRRVYNTTGRDDVHIVSTDGYSAGVYVIRLMDENGLRTQKVVID